jgi:hypothetical protein
MLEAIVATLPALIKAHKDGDRRVVEVEASNEKVDSEGDVILQKALLDSADYFLKSGHLDLDHISELGGRLGIPNPSSYIVGRPLEVKDLGGHRTGVVGEIRRSEDGKIDVVKNRFDEFWESLQSKPAVVWQASIYGFPKADMTVDCSTDHCEHGATRYLVKGIEWRSLAFTRNPINTSLKGHARVITAKAYIDVLRKSGADMALQMPTEWLSPPRSTHELWGQYARHISKDCPFAGAEVKSRKAFRDHFVNCSGMSTDLADMLSNALMMMVIDEEKKSSR